MRATSPSAATNGALESTHTMAGMKAKQCARPFMNPLRRPFCPPSYDLRVSAEAGRRRLTRGKYELRGRVPRGVIREFGSGSGSGENRGVRGAGYRLLT